MIQCRATSCLAGQRFRIAFAMFVFLTVSARAADNLRSVMLNADQVTIDELQSLKDSGFNAIAISLSDSTKLSRRSHKRAASLIKDSDLKLYFWIEVGRCPDLADKHPEWMASLQGHNEWRRFHPRFPEPKDDQEVVKTYPWVPILYKESFAAHVIRIREMLRGLPAAKGIFLNDLQGAPSACGCGHPLCRWTGDYGPIKTATSLPSDTAAQFVTAIEHLAPRSQVIPVWATECEEHDGADDGLCAGVGCFKGICWKAWTEQLEPINRHSDRIGALLTYRLFQRDLDVYQQKAGWVSHGLQSFQTMPLQHNKSPVPAERIIAVLQGWDVTEAQVEAQIRQASSVGTPDFVLLKSAIDQSWQPKMYRLDQ